MDMDRRRFLAVSAISALVPAAAMAVNAPLAAGAAKPAPKPGGKGPRTFGFAADGSAFLLDGTPFQIRSGELHPARIPAEYWRHRIRMAKAMGMNTVSLYLFWNYFEQRPGAFDFTSERRDFVAFTRLCQDEGMWVLLRPGPYVCGEWDLGGIPPYLLRYPDIKLRVASAADPHYMPAVSRYINRLAPLVKPLLVANGGPVLMIQIENEYGSYGADHDYVEEIRQLWVQGGIEGPFYTEDGLGQVENNHTNVPGGAIGLSGGDPGSVTECRRQFPHVPAFGGEVYPGWLTHWGDSTFAGQGYDVSPVVQGFMDRGMSFNLYMLHGGTSFGYYAGANANDASGNYQPDITSYDYSAPITEQGAATRHYDMYRDLIAQSLGEPLPEVPDPIPTITKSGSDDLIPTAFASVWDNLPTPLPTTGDPAPMEMYGQNSGFMLYRTGLSGYTGGTLDIQWVHDYATVFLNGSYQGGFSRPLIPDTLSTQLNVTNSNAPLPLQQSSSDATLDILVEGMGRTNYGHALVDRKGILETVSLEDAGSLSGPVTGWQAFLLPMDEDFVAGLRPGVSDPARPGIFFRAQVTLRELGDTYVDVSNWTKGVVWVNGHNLGRYWTIGPQHRLYCPASWLRRGTNNIVIFDLHQITAKPISLAGALA